MYHPPRRTYPTNEFGAVGTEFIEIHNTSSQAIPLYDVDKPSHAWLIAGGIDFVFPLNFVINPDEYVVLVGFDPDTDFNALQRFHLEYGPLTGVRILGPFTGVLSHRQDLLELHRPDEVVVSFTPRIVETGQLVLERVFYRDHFPWPASADGDGFSLQRIDSTRWANDPTVWTANTPTPGSP
jgi:hypothetical protein